MHPGDKDLITAQIAARNGKTILFVKIQRGADRLADNLAKAGVPVGALLVESHSLCALAHSNYLKSKKTQPSSQLTSQPAVSTWMAFHSLST
jgi:hypothetical protein